MTIYRRRSFDYIIFNNGRAIWLTNGGSSYLLGTSFRCPSPDGPDEFFKFTNLKYVCA